jgi:hypothetical protein
MKHTIVATTIAECFAVAENQYGDTDGAVFGPIRSEGGGRWSLTVYVPDGSLTHPPAVSVLGVAFTLRAIVNRGHIEPRDMPSVHAAVTLLEAAYAQGRL